MALSKNWPTTHEILETGSKKSDWYEPVPSVVPQETRRLLEEYSHIPSEQIIPYLAEMRDRLWAVYPWPCIGQFKFVSLALHRQPSYNRIVDTLKNGGRYLDIGCAVGQDMRYLVLDGCPSTNMFGLEKMSGYVDLGYDLWKDRETLKTNFIIANLLDRTNHDAQGLIGTVDVAHVGMMLHVFSLDGQIEACERILAFMNPRRGSLIVGNSIGRKEPSEWKGPEGTTIYKHNVESFKEMWKEIERRTGQSLAVSGWMDDGLGLNGEKGHWDDPPTTRLFWEVERL